MDVEKQDIEKVSVERLLEASLLGDLRGLYGNDRKKLSKVVVESNRVVYLFVDSLDELAGVNRRKSLLLWLYRLVIFHKYGWENRDDTEIELHREVGITRMEKLIISTRTGLFTDFPDPNFLKEFQVVRVDELKSSSNFTARVLQHIKASRPKQESVLVDVQKQVDSILSRGILKSTPLIILLLISVALHRKGGLPRNESMYAFGCSDI